MRRRAYSVLSQVCRMRIAGSPGEAARWLGIMRLANPWKKGLPSEPGLLVLRTAAGKIQPLAGGIRKNVPTC